MYGRCALLRDSSCLVKSSKNIISAGRNSSDWLKRVKRSEVAGLALGKDGPDATFLLETSNSFLRFTNIQQAAAILSNSKLQLLLTQHLIALLYDCEKIVNVYT